MTEEIRRLFPDFLNHQNEIFNFLRLKRCLLMECSVYQQDEIRDEDKRLIEKERNWFTVKNGTKEIDFSGIEIEKHYQELISYLELNENVSVIRFYSKLDFINKKNKKESEQIEQLHNGRN